MLSRFVSSLRGKRFDGARRCSLCECRIEGLIRGRDFIASKAPPLIIGWREVIQLPELGLSGLNAKIDTGARTSALHARKIATFQKDGETWVRFNVRHREVAGVVDCQARVVDERWITNTSGKPESRLIISTMMQLGKRSWRIELSLADRKAMTMPIILGRTALRRRNILINAGRSWVTQKPGKEHQ